ncbi:MAG: Fic family protein [Syntrophobacter sp.]
MKFLDGLSDDIRKNLLEQLRALWTHMSTAIEGNTLTLGETAFVLSEGLTISGKPLKDHRDIEGHARAVDLMYALVQKQEITEIDLFDLHKLVITEPVLDVYKPVGAWKRENNSTSVTVNNHLKTIEFSDHWEVPKLMERWLQLLNAQLQSSGEPGEILKSYARLHVSFVAIHPFWDGNGRIARLIGNLPCLKAGYPPIIIPKERRYDYIMALADYTLTHGVPSRDTEIIYEGTCFDRFQAFCDASWNSSLNLVEEAKDLQRKRDQRLLKAKDLTP